MFYNVFLSLLVQLCLVSFAAAEETFKAQDNAWAYGSGGGVLGFIVLVLDILVFIEVLKSNRPPAHKLLWCLVVFLFPVIGMVVYWLFSNRAEHNTSGGYESIA